MAKEKFPDHPKIVYVREDKLKTALFQFFSDCIFGPDRRELLASDMRRVGDSAATEAARRIKSLNRTIADIDQKISRQVRNLEREDDPSGTLYRRVQERLQELEDERSTRIKELEGFDRSADDRQNPDLIDCLPSQAPDFTEFSEAQEIV